MDKAFLKNVLNAVTLVFGLKNLLGKRIVRNYWLYLQVMHSFQRRNTLLEDVIDSSFSFQELIKSQLLSNRFIKHRVRAKM